MIGQSSAFVGHAPSLRRQRQTSAVVKNEFLATQTPEGLNRLFVRISAVAAILMLPFMVNNYLEGRILLGAISSVIVGFFLVNVWVIVRRGYHIAKLPYLLAPATIIFLVGSLQQQGLIGALWCYPAVIAFYFILPERIAWLTNTLLLAVTLPIIATSFGPVLSIRIAATLVLVSFMTALFVRVITAQRSELEEVNSGLRAEIDERIEAQRTLAEEIKRHKKTAAELEKVLHAAQSANNAKSRFLSGMTHELRTPLNAIIGFGQMLDGRAGPLTPAQQSEYVQYILTSGDRLYTLINQVLDLAGIEAGRMMFAREEVSLNAVMRRATQEFVVQADALGIIIDNKLNDGCVPFVAADPQRVAQVIANLLSNAIKYNEDGGTVRIEASVEGAMVRVGVSDTGFGIPADRHDQVFETFNRLGSDYSTIEGSGVGLSLTKEFVENMGGEIGFDSAEGVGSTFWFTLPIAEQAALTSAA